MVYGFVKQSGGGIDIHSKLGEGTTIRLIFPVVDETPTQQQRRLLRLSQDGRQAQVLLVDSRIRQDYPETKVLCMTGYSEQVESTLSEQHLLRKPFMRNQLAHKLQELLKAEHA